MEDLSFQGARLLKQFELSCSRPDNGKAKKETGSNPRNLKESRYKYRRDEFWDDRAFTVLTVSKTYRYDILVLLCKIRSTSNLHKKEHALCRQKHVILYIYTKKALLAQTSPPVYQSWMAWDRRRHPRCRRERWCSPLGCPVGPGPTPTFYFTPLLLLCKWDQSFGTTDFLQVDLAWRSFYTQIVKFPRSCGSSPIFVRIQLFKSSWSGSDRSDPNALESKKLIKHNVRVPVKNV
jgi:hypothetical protein